MLGKNNLVMGHLTLLKLSIAIVGQRMAMGEVHWLMLSVTMRKRVRIVMEAVIRVKIS